MKNLRILCMALLFSAMPSMAQEGNMTVELETFEEIKVFDQINVTLVKSDENKAVVSGDDAQEVSIDNDNGRLKIKMEADNFLDGNDTNVVLYYTNDLSLVDANEGAKITSEDDLESKYLTVRSQEGGKIIIGVNARNLDSKAVTGGEITISGSAENQDVNIRSGGQYNAEKLSSNQTDVTILAGGKAMVNVSDFIDANVTAGGTIEIYGNPETVKEDKTLGGSIILK